ncbi:MAG: histidine kinase [Crocinitomicaceae bacterium]|nr:histidine kinase [Crocinitomicaceae bacterium]
MRRVLENSREKTISIESEIETLENYVQLERLTSGSGC